MCPTMMYLHSETMQGFGPMRLCIQAVTPSWSGCGGDHAWSSMAAHVQLSGHG